MYIYLNNISFPRMNSNMNLFVCSRSFWYIISSYVDSFSHGPFSAGFVSQENSFTRRQFSIAFTMVNVRVYCTFSFSRITILRWSSQVIKWAFISYCFTRVSRRRIYYMQRCICSHGSKSYCVWFFFSIKKLTWRDTRVRLRRKFWRWVLFDYEFAVTHAT